MYRWRRREKMLPFLCGQQWMCNQKHHRDPKLQKRMPWLGSASYLACQYPLSQLYLPTCCPTLQSNNMSLLKSLYLYIWCLNFLSKQKKRRKNGFKLNKPIPSVRESLKMTIKLALWRIVQLFCPYFCLVTDIFGLIL